jgi:transcriptional regulator with XRE-family HTH domain
MKLSDYMTLSNLTDDAMARMVGVDRSAVTKWRRGTIRPAWPALARLSDATKGAVTPNDFLRAKLPEQPPRNDTNHVKPAASRDG